MSGRSRFRRRCRCCWSLSADSTRSGDPHGPARRREEAGHADRSVDDSDSRRAPDDRGRRFLGEILVDASLLDPREARRRPAQAAGVRQAPRARCWSSSAPWTSATSRPPSASTSGWPSIDLRRRGSRPRGRPAAPGELGALAARAAAARHRRRPRGRRRRPQRPAPRASSRRHGQRVALLVAVRHRHPPGHRPRLPRPGRHRAPRRRVRGDQRPASAANSATTSAAVDENAPVVQVVTMILTQALRDRASDVHIEPMDDLTSGSASASTVSCTTC